MTFADSLNSVAVIGAGTMGNGIAQVFAQCGYETVVIDAFPESLSRGRGTIEKNLGRMVKKEKITQVEADHALGRLRFETEVSAAEGAMLAIEAVPELRDL